MTQTQPDDEKLKVPVKSALPEVLEERKDILRELSEETLEDAALARAIEEGQRTGDASRSDVLAVLEGGP